MKIPLLHKQKNTGMSHVESLLSQLRHQMQHDPPPALRERLARLSNRRLEETQALAESQHKSTRRMRRIVFSIAAAIGCVLLTGFLAEMLLHKPRGHDQLMGAVVAPHAASAPSTDHQASISSVPSLGATQGAALASDGLREREDRLIIPLPYSDSAVETGTDSVVPVSVSQAELLALGVPVNPSSHDQRFLAELILGSDGLPRALNVPIPLAPVEDMQ